MAGLDTPWGDIRIEELPASGKAFTAVKAVKIDNTTVILGANGKLYCPRVNGKYWYPLANWPWAPGLMRGLVALGKITKAQADQYLAEAKRREEKTEAKYELERLDAIAAKHGLKIAARERAKLVKAAGGAA